jgi:hypothetical protein
MLSVFATYFLTLIKSEFFLNKILKLILILISFGLILWLVFPDFYRGPMAEVNKAIYSIWLNKVSEVQPLWTTKLSNKIIISGQAILFIFYLIYFAVTKKLQSKFSLLLPLICGNKIITDLKSLSTFLNEYQTSNPDTKTVLTFLDFGPELLYRTSYNIIASPYHRNDQGILFSYNVMAAEDSEQVHKMLKERLVDLLIICPDSGEKHFYKNTAAKNTFYEQLVSGKIPSFIEEVNLPDDLNNSFKAYRLID